MLIDVARDDVMQARALARDYGQIPIRGTITHAAPPPSMVHMMTSLRTAWSSAPVLVQALAAALVEGDAESLGSAALNGEPLPRGHAERDSVLAMFASEVLWHKLHDDLSADFAVRDGDEAEAARRESLGTQVGAAVDGVRRKMARAGYPAYDISVEDTIAAVVFLDDQDAALAARRVSEGLHQGRRSPLVMGLAQAVAAWTQRQVWGAMAPDELRVLRKRAGLTQAQLASAVDRGLRTVVSWEQGRGVIDRDTAARIREACAQTATTALPAATSDTLVDE
ncbi:helix-turn-helix transcriptional regulator [Azospirillum rugosum]|uniref:helix-turn-helix transcriptional regulator n=1 Tax=Azospirillum rugosum TaxID=416170 RepID=UPI00361EB7E4